jgi:hypothetical protein
MLKAMQRECFHWWRRCINCGNESHHCYISYVYSYVTPFFLSSFSLTIYCFRLNVAVEWGTVLLHVLEIPGSDLGDRLSLDWAFHGLEANGEVAPKIWPRPIPSTSLPIYYSVVMVSFDAKQSVLTASLNEWEASKNKIVMIWLLAFLLHIAKSLVWIFALGLNIPTAIFSDFTQFLWESWKVT